MEEYERLHCMVPTMIFIPHCEFFYIFILYIKLVIIKRNEEHLSLSIAYPPLRPFHVRTQTISRSSKSKPPTHSRMFHLSLAIYAMTIIVFEAKAWYVHWNSESTHYGHHLCLVVIIRSRAHRTTLYLLMTWLVDQLNAPHGTWSSVASHYLTNIVPTCRFVSTLHLHYYKILKIHSYKKTELVMMVCLPSCNIGRPIYIRRIGRKLWQFCRKIPTLLSRFANKAFPRSSFSPIR